MRRQELQQQLRQWLQQRATAATTATGLFAMGHAQRCLRVKRALGVHVAAAFGALLFLAFYVILDLSQPQAALAAAAAARWRPYSDSSLTRWGLAHRYARLSATSLAAQFEEGLSLQDMLRLQKQRQAAQPGTRANAPDDAKLVASLTAREEVVAELPCVFAPRQQPEKALGDEILVKFFDTRYVKLWDYARARTGGAVAIRYADGSQRRGDNAFALWPAGPGDQSMTGLNLGLFEISVVTIHPFPVVRLLQEKGKGQTTIGKGTSGLEASSPAALHYFLRNMDSVEQQRTAIAEMPASMRLDLLRWLANGASE
mmetsp:Transcript_124854/g.243024  ORF Transcript_124854/g.243024 Transcript_124854/m.243024 type:complete len:314 (+) Transcript_124854:1-942(+)